MFLAEGTKLVLELINSKLHTEIIICTSAWLQGNQHLIPNDKKPQVVNDKQFKKITTLVQPEGIMAGFRIPVTKVSMPDLEKWTIMLDGIKDPGNLGTIIRTADWFGIKQIYCSENCVDAYNEKVVRSTMGSIARVSILKCDISEILKDFNGRKYGAVLDGKHLAHFTDITPGIIVIGSESHGISVAIQKLLTDKISIKGRGKAESLNAAIATGIFLYGLINR